MPYPAQIDPEELGARALAVAEAKGWEQWTLRDVARELGVTANALYRYVGDRAGLVMAMGEAATRQLGQSFRGARRVDTADAEAIVVQLARRYVRFAARRPHAYRAIIEGKPPPEHPARSTWMELWTLMHARVEAAVPGSGDAAAFTLWAFLHGRIELARGPGRLAAIDTGLDDAVRALLAGFRARSPVPSPLPPHVRSEP